jgi:hypothetical protein
MPTQKCPTRSNGPIDDLVEMEMAAAAEEEVEPEDLPEKLKVCGTSFHQKLWGGWEIESVQQQTMVAPRERRASDRPRWLR